MLFGQFSENWRYSQRAKVMFVKTPSSNVFFQLPPNECGCLYTWTTLGSGPAIDIQKMPILAKIKNYLFRWSSCKACKQAKLSHLGHRKSAGIHWKADAPKTNHCLVQRHHNWAIFLRKLARKGRYSQWLSLIEDEDIVNIWFQH